MLAVSAKHLFRSISFEERVRTICLFTCRRSENEDRKAKAAEKLNSLLQSIIKDERIVKDEEPMKLAANETKFKKKSIKKVPKPKNLGEKIVEAAKEVADKVKGEPEITEAELLQKLLYKNENLQKSVLKASQNKKLSELLSEMKIELIPTAREKPKEYEYNRADHVRSLLKDKVTDKRRVSFSPTEEVQQNLFKARTLGLFKKEVKPSEDEVKLNTWDHCYAREMRLSVTHPPSNIYEQMIIWTNRGMLWKFPIDNEQGMDEEQKVSFADHVFLENYLEGWCPERGPIRHFMELVCVGLSRNHWLTAQEKKDHILWYKDYFLEKEELIKQIGAGDFPKSLNSVDSLPSN